MQTHSSLGQPFTGEIIDPDHETLTVLRWTPDGYLTALTAGKTDRVRAEPFDQIELPVGMLFGEEPE